MKEKDLHGDLNPEKARLLVLEILKARGADELESRLWRQLRDFAERAPMDMITALLWMVELLVTTDVLADDRRLKDLYERHGDPPFHVSNDEHLPLGFDSSSDNAEKN